MDDFGRDSRVLESFSTCSDVLLTMLGRDDGEEGEEVRRII